jgi:hypothetical protein
MISRVFEAIILTGVIFTITAVEISDCQDVALYCGGCINTHRHSIPYCQT